MLTRWIQTLPHEREGVGEGGIVVDMLALFTSDLVALTLGALGLRMILHHGPSTPV